MKRADLERHLRRHGCELLREGGKHSYWINPANGKRAPVPRHNEIKNTTANGICRQLSIPKAC
jgi:mRNA interferase HicA